MKIDFGPLPVVREHAQRALSALDKDILPSKYDMNIYLEQLNDCQENITRGMIARTQEIKQKPKAYPQLYWINKSIIEKQPQVKEIISEINSNIAQVYHSTAKLRNYIIKSGRISLDGVKPAKGYTKLDRFLIALTKPLRIR